MLEAVPAAGRANQPAFVDFQNDVTTKDLTLAVREGFRSVEHVKRYTTTGMATDQGKTSNVAGLAIMAAATGKSIPETGTTIYRPPYVGPHKQFKHCEAALMPWVDAGGQTDRVLAAADFLTN